MTANALLEAHGAGPLATARALSSEALRSFVRTPHLLVTTLMQGVLFLLVFRYVFGGAIRSGQLSYVDFMTPGLLTAGIVFAASGAAVRVAVARSVGFADRVRSLPASRPGIVAARVVADTVIVVGAAVVLVVVAIAVGFRPHAEPSNLAAAALLVALYGWAFAAAFGTLGALASGPQAAQGFGFVAIPLTFVSSAYVPTETMPGWLAIVARNQPLTVMIDALRQLTQPHVIPPQPATLVLAVAWALTIALGSMLVARVVVDR